MKMRRISQSLCIALLLLTCCTLSAQSEKGRVRNIVLVHGAWADGSGWKGVYDILVKDGYKVTIVQEPETSFTMNDGDLAWKRYLQEIVQLPLLTPQQEVELAGKIRKGNAARQERMMNATIRRA